MQGNEAECVGPAGGSGGVSVSVGWGRWTTRSERGARRYVGGPGERKGEGANLNLRPVMYFPGVLPYVLYVLRGGAGWPVRGGGGGGSESEGASSALRACVRACGRWSGQVRCGEGPVL